MSGGTRFLGGGGNRVKPFQCTDFIRDRDRLKGLGIQQEPTLHIRPLLANRLLARAPQCGLWGQ